MAQSSKWKTTAIPSELYEKVRDLVKTSPEYQSISEFVRRAVSDLLTKDKENN